MFKQLIERYRILEADFKTKRKLKDGSSKKAAQEAIKHAQTMLGKAKLKLADAKKSGKDSAEEKESVEFWQDRIKTLQSKLHEEETEDEKEDGLEESKD